MKVQISLDDKLVERADVFADANYMSRSGLISLALTQYLNTNDALMAIQNLSLAMKKIADTGNLDHDTIEQLEDFERMSKMFLGTK